jgi:hypothetical protein
VGGGRIDIPNRMITTQAESEDEVEVMLRMLSRGFLDLHLGVRAGDIVDPYAIPETMGEGMQMLSMLCVRASVNDLGDSVHCLSDTARCLPVGDWGVPALADDMMTSSRYSRLAQRPDMRNLLRARR